MDAPASAGFSGAIKIGDISDFIAPAQACVVGLGAAPSGAPKLDAASMVDGDGDGGGVGGVGVVRAAERPSSLAAQAAAAVAGTAPVPKPSNTQKNGAPVKVTLNDCLACSGCVTSAETVLLEAQSAAELDAALARGDTVVVTLSQQSVASLALGGRLRNAAETPSPSEAAAALSGALKSLGVAAVVDAGEPRALALLASAAEFCAVYAASPEGKAALRRFAPRVVGAGGPGGGGGGGEASEASVGEAAALAAASAANAAATALGIDVSAASSRLLPCLASACPGWVCYAEKNAAAAALPHAASAASAQAVAGLLIKRALLKNGNGSGDSSNGKEEDGAGRGGGSGGVFHVSVMPCADKKLESLRDDLVVALEGEGGGAGGSAAEKKEGTEKLSNSPPPPPPPPGTDCVLTTIELSGWLSSRGVVISDLETAPRAPLDSLAMMLQGGLAACRAAAAATATAAPRALLAPSAGTSGGFGEFVFRHAASTLFGVDDLPPGPLPWRAGRNGDVREVVLEMLGPGKRKKREEEEKGGAEEEGTGTVVLRASLHYGFRNIQTLVTKIKSGASHSLPHFVEVMACPSGCVNGGGQLRGVAGGEEAEGEGEEKPSLPPPDGRALAAAVYSSLAEELRPNGSDWYSATLSGARALAGVAWPRGRVEPAGALAARVRDRKAEAEAKAAAAAAEAKGAKAGASAAVAAAAPAPAPMSVDW